MYEVYYGLSGKPFQLNPDPAFYYASRGHKRAFAYLQYGLFQSEGFIVITGEVGAGKTTLVRSLLEQLDSRKVVAAQLVSTQLDADDMLRAVAAAFGLPVKVSDKAKLLLELEAFFVSLAAKRKRALLVVDEAQNLSPRAVEELRMLSNFQLGEHALLQSFLVGQPELRETMRSPHMQQLRQRVLASYHLGPLDREETQLYIEHRLTHVGWTGNPAFDAETFETIYKVTHGVPRRINTLCNRLMLSGYLGEKQVFRPDDVHTVAQEIREELGPEPMLSTPPQDKDPQVDNLARMPGVNELNITQLRSAENSARIHKLANAHTVSALEERIVRLEKTLNEVLALLHKLSQPAAGQNRKGGNE